MYVLDKGTRFVIPRTEMTYPGHSMKLHLTAEVPNASSVKPALPPFVDLSIRRAMSPEARAASSSSSRGRVRINAPDATPLN